MITIKDRRTGKVYTGRTPDAVARRVWGRDTRVVYSSDPRTTWSAMVVQDTRHGTVVLAELYVDEDARAAREPQALLDAARDHRAARDNYDDTRDALYGEIRDAVAAGMSESEAARIAGLDRMTVRKLLGK